MLCAQTLGKEAIITMSRKQQIKTKKPIEVRVVGVDNESSQISLTNDFIKSQGCNVDDTKICQGN